MLGQAEWLAFDDGVAVTVKEGDLNESCICHCCKVLTLLHKSGVSGPQQVNCCSLFIWCWFTLDCVVDAWCQIKLFVLPICALALAVDLALECMCSPMPVMIDGCLYVFFQVLSICNLSIELSCHMLDRLYVAILMAGSLSIIYAAYDTPQTVHPEEWQHSCWGATL